jgi:predicted site-specific integrase-resolvase
MNHEQMLSTGPVADRLGMTGRTVYRGEQAGRWHLVRLPTGQRRFSAREVEALLHAKARTVPRCVVYARVSSGKQAEAGTPDRPRERLVAAAAARRDKLVATVAERASGLNEKRRGLRRLFHRAAADEIDVVLVEFKDRLARFGFAYVVEAWAAHGVRVEVLDGPVATDATQELVQDMLAIVAVFAARLYGRRSQRFRRKVQEAAQALNDEGVDHA